MCPYECPYAECHGAIMSPHIGPRESVLIYVMSKYLHMVKKVYRVYLPDGSTVGVNDINLWPI